MASLNRTFTFAEMNEIAKCVTKYLNFNMPWLLNQAFEKDSIISERAQRLPSRTGEMFFEVGDGIYNTHSFTAATSGGFDE